MSDPLEQPVIDNSQGAEAVAQPDQTIAEYRREREGRTETEHQGSTGGGEKSESSYRKLQRRFDQMTREKGELQRRLQTYESGETRTEEPGKTERSQGQFESIEEYSARIIREAAEREKAAKPGSGQQPIQEKPGAEQPHEQAQREAREHHARSVEAFRSEFSSRSDVKELQAAAGNVKLCAGVIQALPLLPNGPDVFAHIVRNPHIADRINMAVVAAAKAAERLTGGNQRAMAQAAYQAVDEEMSRLSMLLEHGATYGIANSGGQTRYVERPVSQAPTPIAPLGSGGGSASSEEEDADGMSMAEYRKMREKQRNPRRG